MRHNNAIMSMKSTGACVSGNAESKVSAKPLLESVASGDTSMEDRVSSSLRHNNTMPDSKCEKGHKDGENVRFSGAKSGQNDPVSYSGDVEKRNYSNSVVAISSLGQDRAEAINHVASCGSPYMEVDLAADDLLEGKFSLVGSTSQASKKVDAAEEGKDGGSQSDNLPQWDEKSKQLDGPEESTEVKKRCLKSSTEAEGDESDLEEEDVKVCDICGDAGREDLLAVCSRCTDGAEHTYCMRDMLDKVPEGSWLCEECKLNEEMEKQRLGSSGMLAGKESSKRLSSDSIMKLGKKDLSSAGSKADNNSLAKQIPNKRPADSIEVEPVMKRQTIESVLASPSASSPGSIAPLARDNSFKSSDKMNAKQIFNSVTDNSENPQSPNANMPHVPKGTFVKSNSFGISSNKPKFRLVDEIPQKHKQGADGKDASRKLVGKSVSFKGNVNRSNTTESKVKMLSPEDSQILESRGLKQAKERNIFERKNSIKSDYSSCSQMVGNAGKHQARGEVKKQYPNFGGSSSSNGANSVDAKTNAVTIKEGLTSNSSSNQSERTLEKSYNNSSSGSLSGNRRTSVVDFSLLRSSKEGASGENTLKAAIQAAMQKKLDMYKKNKVSEKSNPVSVSYTDSVTGTASADKLPNSANLRNFASTEGESASLGCSSNYCKEAFMNCSVQSKVLSADYVLSSKERDLDLVSFYGEMILRGSVIPECEFIWQGSFEVHRHGTIQDQISGFQAHLSTCASYKVSEIARKFPQKVALDEVPRSCTWPTQFKDTGADEDNIALYFFAKDFESYLKSYKYLLEKMMKDDLALKGTIDGVELLIFPSKYLTARSQRWNMLFFLWGVFKGRRTSCLDTKSARVEKLDICGVDRSPQGKDVASASLSPSDKSCLLESGKENLTVSDSDHNNVSRCEAPVPVEISVHPSPILSNGNCGSKGCSLHQTSLCGMTGLGHHDMRFESLSESSVATRCESTCVREHNADKKMDTECQTTRNDSFYSEAELRSGDQVSPLHNHSFGGISSHSGCDLVEEENMAPVDKDSTVKCENNLKKRESCVDLLTNQIEAKQEDDSRKEVQCMDSVNCQDQVKSGIDPKQEEIDADTSDLSQRNSLVKSFQQLSHGKCPNEHSSTSSEAPALKGQKLPLNHRSDMLYVNEDEERARKRVTSSSFYGCDSSTSMDDVCTSVSLENNSRCKPIPDHDSADSGSAERFFFPVDSSHPYSVVDDDSLRWRVSSSSSAPGNDDRLADGTPSLELALGVENKRPKSGFFFRLGERDQNKPRDARRAGAEEEEGGTASLSLSLAFPFSDKERNPGSRADQATFPETREVNTSLLLFRRLSDK